jgi:2-polyprenyl-3-methyl-5-hydroxy-6-metoxy-1,4-benzoquinol methylase
MGIWFGNYGKINFTMSLNYSVNKSLEIEIINHLQECSSDFVPTLSSYVNIVEYSKKLAEKSTRIECYSDGKLIGLVAIYINQFDSFITNFSVLSKFTGKGVSQNLLNLSLEYIKTLNHKSLFLEVKKQNNRAINFYKKSGFNIIKKNEDNYKMELKIKRDYNKEFKDTIDHKYAYNFDFDVMHHYMIKSFEPFIKGKDVLELGSFKGDFTKRLLPYFSDISCVEVSDEAIEIAKKVLPGDITYYNSLFEDTKLDKKYNNIVLTHVLEHIDNPVSLLSKIESEWLSDDGCLFLVCPNANAPSRQIAVKMGLISHNSAITDAEKEHGHRITYSLDTLERDAKLANLEVTHRSGIFFKALANFQWDKLLNTDIISKEYLDGCYQLGQQYPDLCSSIFLVCKKRKLFN